MMRKLALFLFALVLGSPQPVGAQSKVGTTMLQFLKIEPGARGAAMGNAGTALSEGIDAVYFNAGVIGAISKAAVTFTHSAWFADISYDYAAAALPVAGFGTLFASVTALNSGEIDVRTVDLPQGTGARYTVSDVAVGLGFGRQITSRFAAGMQMRYVTESIWNSSVQVLTFDFGTVYRLSSDGLMMGFGLSNLGTRAGFDGRDLAIQYDSNPDVFGDNSALPAFQSTDEFSVPVMMRLGMSYPRRLTEDTKLLLVLEALHPNDNSESLNAGLEWSWDDAFAVRSGYQTLFEDDSDLGLTFGFGMRTEVGSQLYQLDYAWADHDRLGATHRFTVVLQF